MTAIRGPIVGSVASWSGFALPQNRGKCTLLAEYYGFCRSAVRFQRGYWHLLGDFCFLLGCVLGNLERTTLGGVWT